ncbi:putative bifunctional lysylphosphatidylglycerol flippase/synthetase [Pseudoxanthomonas sp. 10H]|uniref:UPF0104 family protein n=1 Tax=Pseudoxanthomonas sp. 10H TaxID=3242729 RepID=UPI003557B170
MRALPARWRRRAGNLLVAGVLVAVLVLGARHARSVDWPAVGIALRSLDVATLAACLGLVAASYALYCAYELVARRQVGHGLPPGRTAAIGFVCYAVTLNLGAVLGAGGARLRLYTRAGVPAARVARIAGFAVLTNWLGYAALAGAVLAATTLPLPPGAGDRDAWRLAGIAMLALVGAYGVLCGRRGGDTLAFRGHALRVPTLRMASLQLALSTLNWAVLGAILFLLLPAGVAYPRVLALVLVAAVIGVVLHTPAGLGAWESAFLLTLGRELGQPPVLAALLAYRALYYLLPLACAGLVYIGLESRRGRGIEAAGSGDG